LTDERLLAQCEVDTYRASGPGGQKRNKTSSAVRLRHPPTGLIVIAEESRSQHENRGQGFAALATSVVLDRGIARGDSPACADRFDHPGASAVARCASTATASER